MSLHVDSEDVQSYLTQQWGIRGNGGNIPGDSRTFRFCLDRASLFLDQAIPSLAFSRGNPSKGRQFEVVLSESGPKPGLICLEHHVWNFLRSEDLFSDTTHH